MRKRVAFVTYESAGSPLRLDLSSGSVLVDSGSFDKTPNLVLISVDNQFDVRMTIEGTAPSGSVGMLFRQTEDPYHYRGPTGSMAFIGDEDSNAAVTLQGLVE